MSFVTENDMLEQKKHVAQTCAAVEVPDMKKLNTLQVVVEKPGTKLKEGYRKAAEKLQRSYTRATCFERKNQSKAT